MEISATERRIADGGRRTARQEAGWLEEVRRQQESTGGRVRSASAHGRGLEPHIGDPAQQEQTLAAAAEIRDAGADVLAGARRQQA